MKLLQKNVPFQINQEYQKSLQELKDTLTFEPILNYPDFEKPSILTCDASGFSIGTVFSQGEIGKELPTAFASRTLCVVEVRYLTIEP